MAAENDLVNSLWEGPNKLHRDVSDDITDTETERMQLSPIPKVKFSNAQIGGQLIRWVDGVPVPVVGEALSKQTVQQLLHVSASLPYEGEIDAEGNFYPISPEFLRDDGSAMTNMEVSMIKLARRAAAGDSSATSEMLDRILGKPKQATENVNMSMTIAEYLQQLEQGGSGFNGK